MKTALFSLLFVLSDPGLTGPIEELYEYVSRHEEMLAPIHSFSAESRESREIFATSRSSSKSSLPTAPSASTPSEYLSRPGNSGEEFYVVDLLHTEKTILGDSRFVKREALHRIYSNDGMPKNEEITTPYLLQADLIAWRLSRSDLLEVYKFFPGLENESARARRTKRFMNPRDVLAYGFGDGNGKLKDVLNQLLQESTKNEILIQKEDDNGDGRVVYKVSSNGLLIKRLEFDNQKGGMVINSRFYRGSEQGIFREVGVRVAEVKPGVFFPVVWHDCNYHKEEGQTAQARISKPSRNELLKIEFNNMQPEDLAFKNFTSEGVAPPVVAVYDEQNPTSPPIIMKIQDGMIVQP